MVWLSTIKRPARKFYSEPSSLELKTFSFSRTSIVRRGRHDCHGRLCEERPTLFPRTTTVRRVALGPWSAHPRGCHRPGVLSLTSLPLCSGSTPTRTSSTWFPLSNLSPLCAQVFRQRTPEDAINLVSRLLEYTPGARISPLQACTHKFFDELRDPNTRLPNNRDLPPLFNFTELGKGLTTYQ